MGWKVFAFVFAILLYFAAAAGSIEGFLEGGDFLDKNYAKVDNFVFAELENKNNASVIVNLKKGYFLEEFLDIDIFMEFASGGFAANIDYSDLEFLANNVDVEYVESVREFYLNMNDAVRIVGADDSWALVDDEVNLTGYGETVCIIDTGVDFGHRDLAGKNRTSCLINCANQICAEDCSVNDFYGHGTHVAGIVGANGDVKGIAPESSLIGVKVFPDGVLSTSTTNIKNAVDWCVLNKEQYNISVISMSLGTEGVYSNYCDASFLSLANSINNAVSLGISVVASTGNSNPSRGILRNTNAVSSPACISNVIAVSATDKDDRISSYGHYSPLIVKLFAPGTGITSSCLNGNYCSYTGTSMSAPMVSGAIAIINQFLKNDSRNFSSFDIKEFLYENGFGITDGQNNFSRINVFNTIINLDDKTPEVFLEEPLEGSVIYSNEINFSCYAKDLALSEMAFYLWNSSGGIELHESKNISGADAEFNFDYHISNYGDYKWNCFAEDLNGNIGYFEHNYSFNVGGDLVVRLISPSNREYVNFEDNNFSCKAISKTGRLMNSTFYLWNSTDLVYNKTNFIGDSNKVMTNSSPLNNSNLEYYGYLFNYNYNLSDEGDYFWNCLIFDSETNYSQAFDNFSISYDITNPDISLIRPENGASFGAQEISFEFFAEDKSPVNCNVFVGERPIGPLSLENSSVAKLPHTLSSGNYNWSVACEDSAGNLAYSSAREFLVRGDNNGAQNSGGGSSSSGGSSSGRSRAKNLLGNNSSLLNFSDKEFYESDKEFVLQNLDNNFKDSEEKILGRASEVADEKSAEGLYGIFVLLAIIFILIVFLTFRKIMILYS